MNSFPTSCTHLEDTDYRKEEKAHHAESREETGEKRTVEKREPREILEEIFEKVRFSERKNKVKTFNNSTVNSSGGQKQIFDRRIEKSSRSLTERTPR